MAGVGKFVLDFLGNTARSIAAPVVGTGIDIGTDIRNAVEGTNLTPQQIATQGTGVLGTLARAGEKISDATGTTKNLASNVAGTAVLGAAPVIGEAGAGAVGAEGAAEGAGLGAKVAAGAAKGAAQGAAIGGAFGASQGIQSKNAKQFGLDFIESAGLGAATGGLVGGAVPAIKAAAPLNQAGFAQIPGRASDQFSQEDLQKMANNDDVKAVEKQLKPVTGDVVAQQIAPAVAKANDPDVAARIIDNSVNNKITPGAPGVPNPSPAPEPLPPTTPTSDINTPTQVAGQANNAEAAFMNGPEEQNVAPRQISKSNALNRLHSDLSAGLSVIDARERYMEGSGANFDEAQNMIKNTVQNNPTLQRSNINAVLNPRYEEGRQLVQGEVAANDTDSVMNKTQMAHNTVMREGAKAITEVQKLSPQDQQLLSAARDKTPEQVANAANTTAQNPAQFLKAWQATTNYDQFAHGVGSGGLGQDVAFRQNHLLTRYVKADTGELNAQGQTQQAIRPSYSYGRDVNAGGEPAFDNFLDELKYDVENKSNQISQLTFAKSLGEAYPDQVAQGNLPAGYKQVNLPFAKGISLPSDMATDLNKRSVNPATGKLAGYDTINSAMKNLKLGGGLFHALNVMGSFGGQQIASGKAFTNPGALADVMKATFSDDAMRTQMSQLDQQGMLRAADRLGLVYNKYGVSADVGAESNRINNLPFLKQVHESIFGRQIPMMKVLSLQQKLDQYGIDPNNMSDEDVTQGTKLAKQLNQNYGGLNRMIQGLTPNQFKVVARGLLATDYTEGQLKTLIDAFTKGGADGRLAREVVAGKALLWGGLATAGGAAGGEFKGMTPKQVAEDIAMKIINPSFQFGSNTIGLPETQVSEFVGPLAKSIRNAQEGANAANPFKDFATARLAAPLSLANQYIGNRNFQGQAFRGTDYYGRPISTKDTLLEGLGSVAPIPIAQGAETGTGQQSLSAAVANTAGLRVTPTYPASYAPIAGQTYISELEKTPGVSKAKINQTTEFFDLLEQTAHTKTKTITAAEKAITAKDPQKANQIIQNYNQKLVSALLPWARAGGTQYLDSTMIQALNTAEITYGKASENIPYLEKTNPTSIGAPIQALATQPQTVGAQQ